MLKWWIPGAGKFRIYSRVQKQTKPSLCYTHTTTAGSPYLLTDPWCNPSNPVKVSFRDVSAASHKLRGDIFRTPCTKAHKLSSLLGVEIYFKKDFLMTIGSFKERGVRNTLSRLPAVSLESNSVSLFKEQRKVGVVAASSGNHALALSYHGQLLNIPVSVVMPTIAPMVKIQLCKSYDARVIIQGHDIIESKEKAMKMVQDEGLLYINGYDHPHIIAGQGTMGVEVIEDVPDMDAIIIPVGGGGLLAGTVLAIKHLLPNVTVIGVESDACPSFTKALEAGKPVLVQTKSTLADGLAVPFVGYNAFETAKNGVDKMVLVNEQFIALAILRLIENEKAVVEGAGAIGLGALLQGLLPELKGKKVVIPLGGGNIDTSVLGRCIERGLVQDGRLMRFVVTVSDRPGGIAELTKLLAFKGASIKDIYHERAWPRTDIYSVLVRVTIETRDAEHCAEIEAMLREHYEEVKTVLTF